MGINHDSYAGDFGYADTALIGAPEADRWVSGTLNMAVVWDIDEDGISLGPSKKR